MLEINIALEIMAIVLSIILLICCLRDIDAKSKQLKILILMLITNILVLLSDCITYVICCNRYFDNTLYVCNFFVYTLGYVMTALFSYYLLTYISAKVNISPAINRIITIMCVFAIAAVCVSMYNHMYFRFENGLYIRGNLYLFSQVYPVATVLTDMVLAVIYRKNIGIEAMFSLLSYGFFPLVAIAIQIHFYGITLLYIASTFSMFTIYITIHLEQAKILKQKELELANAKCSAMINQIQPHFIYNTLGTIRALCVKDPQLARKAIDCFSKYLRRTMQSVNKQDCIMFGEELEEVQNYLFIEKLRFDKKLHITYNIEEKNFMCPPLILQTITENAVKHGICSKDEGGNLIIHTFKENSKYVIEVIDDGIGFDTTQIMNIESHHIGINNSILRLKEMCGGSMKIESQKTIGTKVTIIIPEDNTNV